MISIKNLTKVKDSKKIIDNLSVNFPSRKITFITGKSGSGKTTLLNMISKIEKPDSGEIDYTIDSQIVNIDNKTIENNIDIMFQNINLLEDHSGIDNLKLALQGRNLYIPEAEIIKKAKLVNLDKETLKRPIKNLSGGEKQRIALLRAILRGSTFLLCDEPTGNLDEENAHDLLKLISTLAKDKTVLIVSHDLSLAKEFGDYIYYLQENKLIENSSKISSNTLSSSEKPTISRANLNFKLRNLFKFSFVSLKSKWAQFLLVLLFMITCVLSVGLSINISNINKITVSKNLKKTNWDLYYARKKDKTALYPNEIEELYKTNDFKHIAKTYLPGDALGNLTIQYESNKIDFFGSELQGIDNSNFMKDRLLNDTKIDLSDPFSIIISKKFVEKLKINNPIGKKISLTFNDFFDSPKHEFTIKGINPSNAIDEPDKMFINREVLKQIYDSEKVRTRYFLTFYSNEFVGNFEFGELILENNVKIIDGSLTKLPNEILISSALNNEIKNSWKQSEILLEHYFGKYKVKVAGIFESNEKLIATSQENYNFFNVAPVYNVVIYSDNQNFVSDHKSLTNTLELQRKVGEVFSSIIEQNLNNLSLIKNLSIAIFVFSIFALLVIFKILSDNKRKDLGIFKILNYKFKDIMVYFCVPFLTLIFVSLILTVALFYPMENLILSALKGFEDLQTTFKDSLINYLFVWGLISIVSFSIYSIFLTRIFLIKNYDLFKSN